MDNYCVLCDIGAVCSIHRAANMSVPNPSMVPPNENIEVENLMSSSSSTITASSMNSSTITAPSQLGEKQPNNELFANLSSDSSTITCSSPKSTTITGSSPNSLTLTASSPHLSSADYLSESKYAASPNSSTISAPLSELDEDCSSKQPKLICTSQKVPIKILQNIQIIPASLAEEQYIGHTEEGSDKENSIPRFCTKKRKFIGKQKEGNQIKRLRDQSRERKPLPRHFEECSPEQSDSTDMSKRKWLICKKTVMTLRATVRRLQRENKRLKSRVAKLKALERFLKSENQNSLLSEDARAIINAAAPTSAGEIIERFLKGPSRQKYTPQLRAFALTLSFYSRKAYEYVRTTFNNSLPHIDTISRWYRSIDGSPGFTEKSLQTLKVKVQEMESKGFKMLCNLVMDEMAVRRHIQLSGKKLTGYVDIGTGVDGDNIPEAKNALVYMLVAVNGHWKIPVGYFIIDGLNGAERANLVENLLRFLNDSGVTLTSLTFDGAACNITMAYMLGANFDNVKSLITKSSHPITGDDIFIFLDICHMLKLVRNCLATYESLTDMDGNIINWKYFEMLVELQNREGLQAGNKIKTRHLKWFNEKMKVKIAAQTLSNSVADALLFLEEDLKLEDFQGAKATAKFCKVINNMFDIFNSRSRFSNHLYKNSITAEKAERIFDYLEYCKNYIYGLKLNGVPVLSTNRKIGFLGFLISIESLKGLCQKYLVCDSPLLKYILTYKLSQDHLELFFSAIRSKGGSNNNPTAYQFEAIYKRLLIHTEIKGSNFANAVALDNTSILCTSSITKNNEGDNLEESEEYLHISTALNDHDYISSSAWHLTLYSADIVAYIAGFVVKCLQKCLTCEKCLDLLETEESISSLQIKKTFGRMIKASFFVVKICKTAESCLRIFLSTSSLGSKKDKLIDYLTNSTVRNLSITIYEQFNNHSLDDDPLNDHSIHLIKLIIKHYLKVRIHHETAKINGQISTRVRSLLTKSVTFKHQ